MIFVLLMEGTNAGVDASITPDWLRLVADAITVQLNRDFALYWGGGYLVRVGATKTDILKNEIAFAILDSLPNAPGAIAYHDIDGNAVPAAFLGLNTCNTLADVSTAISHECCETGADPGCNLWADDGAGQEWAREACDAVESSNYSINTIAVSDFVLPSFFVRGGQAPYSFMSQPSGPFQTAPGGYQIRRASGAGESQVTGDLASKRGVRAVSGKHHWSSRAARRGVTIIK